MRKIGSGGYKVSGGLHGVGISVVNALSEWVNVTVYRDGSEFNQRFEKGLSKGELQAKSSLQNLYKKELQFVLNLIKLFFLEESNLNTTFFHLD